MTQHHALHHALRDQLLHASTAELRRRLIEGNAVDAAAIEGFSYRGTSLGLPRVVEQLTWKTFQKTFWRHPHTGRLYGWNVRLHQDGVDAPSRPKTNRAGEPVTTWFYEVLTPANAQLPASWPRGFDRGLIIDYARAPAAATGASFARYPRAAVQRTCADTVRLVKDPLVDVGDGSGDVLLGVSTVSVAGLCVETPSYFLLEREGPIAHVPERLRTLGQPRRAAVLLPFERRWAELIFDAVLGADPAQPGGLPAFCALDHGGFWRTLDARTPRYFGPGLRATVHALNAAPLALPGVRRPLCGLTRVERIACVERLAQQPGFAVRQMLATAKILACLAYFEHDAVRARLGGGATLATLAAAVQPCAARA